MIYRRDFWSKNILNNKYNWYNKSQDLGSLKDIFNLDIKLNAIEQTINICYYLYSILDLCYQIPFLFWYFFWAFVLIILSPFYSYLIPDTVLIYSRLAAISMQFFIFIDLINSKLSLACTCYISLSKLLHQWLLSLDLQLICHLLWQTHSFLLNE